MSARERSGRALAIARPFAHLHRDPEKKASLSPEKKASLFRAMEKRASLSRKREPLFSEKRPSLFNMRLLLCVGERVKGDVKP